MYLGGLETSKGQPVWSKSYLYNVKLIKRELNWWIMPRVPKSVLTMASASLNMLLYACLVLAAAAFKEKRILLNDPDLIHSEITAMHIKSKKWIPSYRTNRTNCLHRKDLLPKFKQKRSPVMLTFCVLWRLKWDTVKIVEWKRAKTNRKTKIKENKCI